MRHPKNPDPATCRICVRIQFDYERAKWAMTLANFDSKFENTFARPVSQNVALERTLRWLLAAEEKLGRRVTAVAAVGLHDSGLPHVHAMVALSGRARSDERRILHRLWQARYGDSRAEEAESVIDALAYIFGNLEEESATDGLILWRLEGADALEDTRGSASASDWFPLLLRSAKDQRLHASSIRVFLALLAHAGDQQSFRPRLHEVARDLGVNKSTVSRALVNLEECGYVVCWRNQSPMRVDMLHPRALLATQPIPDWLRCVAPANQGTPPADAEHWGILQTVPEMASVAQAPQGAVHTESDGAQAP